MFRRNILMPASRLFDQTSFYRQFEKDLRSARQRIIIESPFITNHRFYTLLPLLERAMRHGTSVIINTRNPHEHELWMRKQACDCIATLQELDASIFYTTALHRKIAIVDDVAWEGSLNILSQSDSCEIMRRTESPEYVGDLIKFTKMSRWYNR